MMISMQRVSANFYIRYRVTTHVSWFLSDSWELNRLKERLKDAVQQFENATVASDFYDAKKRLTYFQIAIRRGIFDTLQLRNNTHYS